MKKHILSIDDEKDIRELLQEVLTIKGYRVTAVAEPDKAMKVVQEDPPDLIIMDFQIEEGDGFVLIEDIKKLGPNIPILLLTGAVFDRTVVRDTIEKKVSRYLDKTSSLNTIVTEIQKLLGDSPRSPGDAAITGRKP
ncbi:MAG: response regulator [Limisphaerales bacterium]